MKRKRECMKDFIDTAVIGISPSPKEESVSLIFLKIVHYIFHTSHTASILWHRATKYVTLVSYTAAPPRKYTLHITMLTRKQRPAFIDWTSFCDMSRSLPKMTELYHKFTTRFRTNSNEFIIQTRQDVHRKLSYSVLHLSKVTYILAYTN